MFGLFDPLGILGMMQIAEAATLPPPKPRVMRFGGDWYCLGTSPLRKTVGIGIGKTPSVAYNQWAANCVKADFDPRGV